MNYSLNKNIFDLFRHIRNREWSLVIRWLKHLYQRLIRGWDDSELWSLDSTIAEFLLPRLKKFRKKDVFVRDEEFFTNLDNLIFALEVKQKEFDYDSLLNYKNLSKEDKEREKKGLKNFYKIFHRLWF